MDVSIIIPCYNAIGKIEKCLASLRSIEYPKRKYEVIFVDDCSRDRTLEFLKKEQVKESNWSVFQLDKNSGSPSRPRNEGIRVARGKYVFFLDCDDEIFPDTLGVHVAHANKTGADVVRGFLVVDNGTTRLAMNKLSEFHSLTTYKDKVRHIIQKQSTTVPSLIKKGILSKHNLSWPEDIRMGEDTVFLIKVLSNSRCVEYVEHPTFVYHKSQGNVASSTQTYGKRELQNHVKVWKTAQIYLKEIGLDYCQLRLQVGLQTAIQSMIRFNTHDIDEYSFELFHQFVKEQWELIQKFNYIPRIKNVLKFVVSGDYSGFRDSIKLRMVIAGYDLKFIKPIVPLLQEFYQIRIDEWVGHDRHDDKHSRGCLEWADVIFCEWMLGNAVWYSKNRKKHQKLVIRMHRFELTTNWYKQIEFEKVHAIIAVSVYFVEKLIEYTRVPRGMVRLVPNFVDINAYDKGEKNKERLFNLSMIGILPSRKGYKRALQILNELVKKDKRYQLFIYGKSPEELSWIAKNSEEMSYYQSCNSFIEQKRLQDHVHFKGWVDVKSDLGNIGYVLSTSETEEIPESFHLAPADGFSAGGQGLLLNWNGIEYIYPSKYIFDDVNKIAEHIENERNGSIDSFYQFNQEAVELIASRYSSKEFVQSIRGIINESEYDYSIHLHNPIDLTDTDIMADSKFVLCENIKLSPTQEIFKIPDKFLGLKRIVIEYEIVCSTGVKINSALLSLKLSKDIVALSSFSRSPNGNIGFYKYLNTKPGVNSDLITVDLPAETSINSLGVCLWGDVIGEIHVNYILVRRI